MDLDDILDVDDFAVATIAHLVERIAMSSGEAQLVYRETELDELWRLLDIEIARTETSDISALADLRAATIAAHDLVGIDGAPAAASQRLRAGLAAWQEAGAA